MNAPLKNPIRLGCSSWSSPDWKGVFYSETAKPADFIAEYARRYSTVEIDSTFYGIPRPATVEAWRDRTPEGFLFAAKAPQAITHEKFLADCQDDLAAFLKTMSILGSRLGPVLFQFPYYARKSGVSVKDFLERLRPFLEALPAGEFQFAVEVRNKAWIAAPLLEALARHAIPLALIDHPWMHPPDALFAKPDIFTGNFAYIRWLGDRYAIEKITKQWDRTVIDRDSDLQRWGPLLRQLRSRRIPVLGYVNNHYSGHAPADVDKLIRLIAEDE